MWSQRLRDSSSQKKIAIPDKHSFFTIQLLLELALMLTRNVEISIAAIKIERAIPDNANDSGVFEKLAESWFGSKRLCKNHGCCRFMNDKPRSKSPFNLGGKNSLKLTSR